MHFFDVAITFAFLVPLPALPRDNFQLLRQSVYLHECVNFRQLQSPRSYCLSNGRHLQLVVMACRLTLLISLVNTFLSSGVIIKICTFFRTLR